MLKDGLFTRFPRPDFALSLHDDDTMPAGTIGCQPGPFSAMSDGVTMAQCRNEFGNSGVQSGNAVREAEPGAEKAIYLAGGNT